MAVEMAQVRVGMANATPFLLGMVLAVVSMLPSGMPELSYVTPSLALMVVYFWTIHRPETMPAMAVFAIGLWQDILHGGPMGLTSLILLVMWDLVANQRRVFIGKSFMVAWSGFAVVTFGTLGLGWIFASWWHWSLLALVPFLVHMGLTIALYPIFAAIFSQLQNLIFEES